MNRVGGDRDEISKWLNERAAQIIRQLGPGTAFPQEDGEFAENTTYWVKQYLARYFDVGDIPFFDGDDLAGTILQRAVQYFPRFRGTGTYTGWLYVIGRNTAVRPRKEMAEAPRALEEEIDRQQSQFSELVIERIDNRVCLDQLLATLPQKYADVLHLMIGGKSTSEVSGILGIAEGSVRSRCSRALRLLSASRDRIRAVCAVPRAAQTGKGPG